ncbi:uncharacterized protein isoform X2 [Musca autumnalis]|uniref:uncharacterized protein isoform X2 n=1 Tax=Musca autumnalis TaxID=221902 RepID=UPI003CE9F82F
MQRKMNFLKEEQSEKIHRHWGKQVLMLQTAASLIVQDEMVPQADALRGQPQYGKPSSEGAGSGTVKRRPGNRKRKRRPQVVNEGGSEEEATVAIAPRPTPYWRVPSSEENTEDEFKPLVSPSGVAERRSAISQAAGGGAGRRRKPTTIREPFSALEKEQKLYELRNTKTGTSANKENGHSSGNRNSENVKNILKNSGGLSLSEILQQKNLSLDDLLKGKQNALQALQTTATTVSHNSTKDQGSRYTAKPKFKLSSPSVKPAGDHEGKEHSKLTALQKLKLFGSASRPVGSQVGLVDHLTTRKKEPSPSTTSTTTTTTAAPTTRIPLYKKLLHQRSTLRPAFLLKNSQATASAEPEHATTTMAMEPNSKEDEDDDFDEDDLENSTTTMETWESTTWRMDTTTTPPTTTTTRRPLPTQITAKPITKFSTLRERANSLKELSSTRRMHSTTRGTSRASHRFTTTSSTTAQPPITTTFVNPATTTTQTTTTTTKTSTTTASSSTMNLTPRANLNLNTDDIRERIQETLLKNLIEKEQSYKKQTYASKEAAEDADDDLENFFEETVKPKNSNQLETSTITTRMKQYSSTVPSSTTIPPSTQQTSNIIPDYDNVDDRTDLLELIEDRRSGNRLFKVLEQRNMTLDELIEHRKRGSSQLHLATIVQTPSRYYPDKKVLLQDNMDIVTAFENFPHFNLLNLKSVKPDDIKTDSQGSSYFTSIIDIEPTDEIFKNGKTSPQGLTEKVSLLPDRSDKSLGFFPSWKTLALASLASTTTTKKESPKQAPYYLAQPKMLLENNNSDEDDYEIRENQLVLINSDDSDSDDGDGDAADSSNSDVDYRPQSPVQAAVRVAGANNLPAGDNLEQQQQQAHDLVDLELSGHGFKRSPMAAGALAGDNQQKNFYANMPAGIKSAIVASATIVMTALVTFMVIFAVCRWKQKHSRMSNIMKSYNAMKSKLPPIAMTTATAASASLAGGANATASTSCTRHPSLREMNSLLGGSGLSVAATITTTTTGVPNTPSPSTSQTTVALSTSAAAPAATSSSSSQHSGVGGGQQLLRASSRKYNPLQQTTTTQHMQQRPSSLLFHRAPPNNNHNHQQQQQHQQPTNLAILSNCNLTDLRRTSANDLRGSTTSLSFSLTSGHNIPNTHINSMDANSPEVQEYLFDTLRNSF